MLTGGALQKAMLLVVDGDPETRELPFMYNPAELTTAKSANWNRPQQKGAGSAGKPQFTGAGPQTVQMEIWFDAWDAADADVARSVMTLFEWTKPTPTVDHEEAAPPAGPGLRVGEQPDPRRPQVLPQDRQRQVRPVQARRDAGPGERDDHARGGPGGPAEPEPDLRVAREPAEPPASARATASTRWPGASTGTPASGAGSPPSTRSTTRSAWRPGRGSSCPPPTRRGASPSREG